MNAYSMDLRERIVAARGAGESVVSVSQRFGVCTKTVRAYQARAKLGQLAPLLAPLPRPGKAPRLRREQEAAFVTMVQEKTTWRVVGLGEEWERRTGVALPSSTLHDHLKRLGAGWGGATKKESHRQ